jgi:hypothetical protein
LRQLAELLLLAGAKRGFGARLEGGDLRISEEIVRNFKEQTGKNLVADRTGITIYEPPAEIHDDPQRQWKRTARFDE